MLNWTGKIRWNELMISYSNILKTILMVFYSSRLSVSFCFFPDSGGSEVILPNSST